MALGSWYYFKHHEDSPVSTAHRAQDHARQARRAQSVTHGMHATIIQMSRVYRCTYHLDDASAHSTTSRARSTAPQVPHTRAPMLHATKEGSNSHVRLVRDSRFMHAHTGCVDQGGKKQRSAPPHRHNTDRSPHSRASHAHSRTPHASTSPRHAVTRVATAPLRRRATRRASAARSS